MVRSAGALVTLMVTLVVPSTAGAQCVSRPSTSGTCSESLELCSRATSTPGAACRRAHADCLKTGRWVLRLPDGRCMDGGARRKQ